MTNGTEEEAEDDGTVRCICGYDDYPGPPPLGDDDSKHGVRQGIEEPAITVADVTEELSGFFLQCDICKVWQHGGCVGIMNEEASPDEYFCEECRKDLHKIFTAPNEYVESSIPSTWSTAHLAANSSRQPNARTWRRSKSHKAGCFKRSGLQQPLPKINAILRKSLI